MFGMGKRAMALLACAALAAGGTACAAILGVEDGILESEGGPDATTEAQAGDAGRDATPSEAESDAAGCATRTVDDATGIFVTPYGADGPSCGTRASPCLTVGEGISQAQLLQRSTVYISRGTYAESVTVSTGLTLEGAWDTENSTWVPICSVDELSAVALAMPSTANVVVTAGPGATGVVLRYLSVLGNTQTAQPGQSLDGVVAQNASLTLDSVIVTMGSGGDGTGGDTGTPGAAGAAGCPADAGANGAGAGNAPPTAPGIFGPSGYVSSQGQSGSSDGGTGANGTCTLSPSCITVCGTCQAICPTPTSGCGGGPGGGGAGGQGGGSSIAIYGWNAQLTIVRGFAHRGQRRQRRQRRRRGRGRRRWGRRCDAGHVRLAVQRRGLRNRGRHDARQRQRGGRGRRGRSRRRRGRRLLVCDIYAGGDAGTLALESLPALSHGTAGQGGVANGAPGQAANEGP